ncbi:MAG: hypothetical protein ACPKOI_05780 [Pleomorphochaeta sp.]
MFNKDVIAKVKEANPNKDLFIGKINFNDQSKKAHEVEFIYRKPTVADMEFFNSQASKNAMAAQNNLINNLIVYPDKKEVIEKIKDYPAVVAEFVESQISPFFGAQIVSESLQI